MLPLITQATLCTSLCNNALELLGVWLVTTDIWWKLPIALSCYQVPDVHIGACSPSVLSGLFFHLRLLLLELALTIACIHSVLV
jgi:hypothetical protein